MIETAAIAENMRSNRLAAVVLDLMIRLIGLLGREKTWSGAEDVGARGKASRIAADREFDARQWVVDTRSRSRVHDTVAELGVSKANAVCETAGAEVESGGIHRGMVHVSEGLKRVRYDGQNTVVLVVGEAKEGLVVVIDLPIQLADYFGFLEGRIVVSGCSLEWKAGQNRIEQVLLGVLSVDEEEKFVLNNGAAKVAPKLIALEIVVGSARKIGVERLIAKIIVSLAVVRVRTRLGGDIHGTGGSQFSREIERGLLNLKFLNRAFRNVLRGRAYGFIADVEAVDFNARGPSEASAE